ncbi:cytochrome P450, partial [Westerdykella ornata]
NLWLARGPHNIWTVVSKPQSFDFIALNSLFLKNVLGMSKQVIDMVRGDDSGIGWKPFPNSLVVPERRFLRMKHKATHDVIGRDGLAALTDRFDNNLSFWILESHIGEEWTEMPDLYAFLKDMLFKTSVDAFFGPRLLQHSPDLGKDLWRFDEDVISLVRGLPKIFNAKTTRARDRCIEAIRNWRETAIHLSNGKDDDKDWEPNWGLKCMRLRNEVFQKFPEWDSHACAATDTALLWAMNTNVVPATFWFIFELLRDPVLRREAQAEVRNAAMKEVHGKFDRNSLTRQPFLQSVYSETLRRYVAIMMIREAHGEQQFGNWTIPRGDRVVVCSYTEHMNPDLWNTGTSDEPHPIEEFWGKRFLVPDTSPPVYTMEGPSGRWIPYGLGERMCPGRHFAKTQMLLTFAMITRSFDMEIMMPAHWKPNVDMAHFGLGTLPPKDKVRFRIKRKAGHQ